MAVRRKKITLTLNKTEMCIWDLSKVLMFEVHYGYNKTKYGNNSRLLFTDTDSLMSEIKTKEAYEGFSKVKRMFDFSSYSTGSKYYDYLNKLVVGKMKHETAGVEIKEFFGLKPKMYSFVLGDISEH